MSSGHCPRPGYLLCLNNASTRMHLSLFPIHYLYTGRYITVSMSSETCVMKLSQTWLYNLQFLSFEFSPGLPSPLHLAVVLVPPMLVRTRVSPGFPDIQAPSQDLCRQDLLLPYYPPAQKMFSPGFLLFLHIKHFSTNPPTWKDCNSVSAIFTTSFIFYTVLPSYWITTEKVPTETTLPDWTFYSARFPNISIHPKVSSDGGFPEASKS